MTRLALFAALAAAAAAVWATGAYARVTPEGISELVTRAGVLGPIVFIALFAAAETVHLPGVLFVIASAALWPPSVAIPTAYIGAMTASLVIFLLSRRLVPASVRERLPHWLLRYESRLETHGLTTVIGLRLVLFLMPAVHWLLGASRVSFRDYSLGTAIGLAPGVVLYVMLGRQAFAHWDAVRPWALGIGGALAALAIASRLTRPRPSP